MNDSRPFFQEQGAMKSRLPISRSIVALALALASTSAACHKATFVDPAYPKVQTAERWTDFFLFGLVGEENIDAHAVCGDQIAAVRTGGNVGTDVVSIITLGIYTPRKIYVTCAAPVPAVAVPPAEEAVVARNSSPEVSQ